MDSDPDKWLQDNISDSFAQLYRVEEMLYSGRTEYQNARIMRSGSFGLCLVLDGKIQSTEMDEFIYHEALVQPAMIAHPGPEAVFIAGGGEGATLREALSHKSVKKAVMVDIDRQVIELCRKYLPGHSRGSFEDPWTELYHTDAREFLSNTQDRFDIVIIDLPDPIEQGPAYLLYTREFYEIVRERLSENGVIAVQAGSATITELLNLTAVNNTLKSVFPIVDVCTAHVPCFGGPWGFCFASMKISPAGLLPGEVDGRISARGPAGLGFYDGISHRGMFSLPVYLRKALSEQARLITDNEPLYIYTG
jgi:spermidine synthase